MALHLREDINITPPNDLFMPKNYFKLLLYAELMSDISYFIQQNIFSGYRQSL